MSRCCSCLWRREPMDSTSSQPHTSFSSNQSWIPRKSYRLLVVCTGSVRTNRLLFTNLSSNPQSRRECTKCSGLYLTFSNCMIRSTISINRKAVLNGLNIFTVSVGPVRDKACKIVILRHGFRFDWNSFLMNNICFCFLYSTFITADLY